MRFARARLLVASLAFAAWVGWLGYQALSRGRDYPVLSHSQFLVSTLDVIADVTAGPDGKPSPVVTVREVRWPAAEGHLIGKTITVANLPSDQDFGYRGPGEYILPLVVGEKSGEHRVAGVPRSPGFEIHASYIYQLTPATRQQLEAIPKPK